MERTRALAVFDAFLRFVRQGARLHIQEAGK